MSKWNYLKLYINTYVIIQNTPSSFPSVLFYQANMACFFEKKRNEEKLDMLSKVLDIKDWSRISANA